MAALQGTILASKIVPTDSLDTYATHEDKYGRGGHRSVNTLEERDNITTPRRKEGMTVYVKENKTKYILESGIDNANWKVDSSGGGSGGSVDLSEYYKKTETYSKIEVDTKIADIPTTDLSGYYKKTETETLLSNKVDKEVGKGLSTNDFTDTFKQALELNKVQNITTNSVTKKLVVTYTDGTFVDLNLDDVITDVKVEGAVLDATTNVLTILSSDGGADVTVDLSVFVTNQTLSNALVGKADKIHSHTTSDITGLDAILSNKVTKNEAIIGATKTKITYDGNGLVINGADLSASDIPNLPQSKITNLVSDLSNKQSRLISGTNIKTINSQSVLGSGDIVITGGGNMTPEQVNSLNRASISNVLDLNNLSGRMENTNKKIFVELPEPSLVPNEFVYKIGKMPTLCFSDGLTWYDVSNQTELTNWWLPNNCLVYVDFINNRYYFNGGVKTLSDLTLELNGGYSINTSINTNELSIYFDEEKQKDLIPTGSFLSFTEGFPSGGWFSFYPYDTFSGRIYMNNTYSDVAYLYPNYKSKIGEGGIFSFNGNRRVISSFSKGGTTKTLVNNGTLTSSTSTVKRDFSITKIGFGCNVHSSAGATLQLVNSILKKAVILNKKLSDFEMEALGRGGVYTPLHLVGDSFLNNYVVASELNIKLKDKPYYIGISQDNQGGASLKAHALRYSQNNPKWHNSVLIIGEFGRDGTQELFITALKDMLSRIRTDKWLVLEPAPLNEGNTQELWDNFNSEIIKICGSRYVRTLQPAWDLSDGSSEDIAEVNKGLWPLSLKLSVSNFHPNAKGYEFIGNLIYEKLIEMNWIS